MRNSAECGIWCWDPRVQEASRRVSCQDASARREQSVVCDIGIRCSDGSAGAAHRFRRGAPRRLPRTSKWPMADDVVRGGIGSLRAPCGASGT
eukprot:476108-Prymnesium_polylepis.1